MLWAWYKTLSGKLLLQWSPWYLYKFHILGDESINTMTFWRLWVRSKHRSAVTHCKLIYLHMLVGVVVVVAPPWTGLMQTADECLVILDLIWLRVIKYCTGISCCAGFSTICRDSLYSRWKRGHSELISFLSFISLFILHFIFSCGPKQQWPLTFDLNKSNIRYRWDTLGQREGASTI